METRFPLFRGKNIRLFAFWLVVAMVVVVDQATKEGAVEILEHGPIVVIPGVLDFVYVQNTGAAFSIGQGGGLFFVLIAIAFLVGANYFVWTTRDLPVSLACTIGLIAGGGVGNMIDRLMEGYVIDFIATTFIDFPVFNVADICVTVGIVCTIVGYWLWEARREREANDRVKTLRQDDGLDDGLDHA